MYVLNRIGLIISAGRFAVLLWVIAAFSGYSAFAGTGTITSQFFRNDATALQIIEGGTPYDMNDPAWLDPSNNQNKNTFAYKLFSALFMLGYQTGISYNAGYSWKTPHLLALHAFQTKNDLPVSDSVTSVCLLKMDQLLLSREQALGSPAQGFQLYDHMQPLHANDISRDALALLYALPMAVLPTYLQMSNFELVQCIAGQCNGFIQDADGNNIFSWPSLIDLSTDYRFVGAYFDRLKNNSRMPSAAVHVGTVLHEYAHYLDGWFPWTKQDALQTHLGSIDTHGFHNISYDMNSGHYCYVMRSPDPKDWITKYGFVSQSNCAAGTSTVFEEWAEAFSVYVTAGRDFRAAAQQSSMIAQKYAWLKDNVFYGLEYDTDLPRGIESGCNDVYGTGSAQPGYTHCNDNYVWDFTLPSVQNLSGTSLYANFAGYGLGKWNSSAWSLLTGDHPVSMVVSGATLYAGFADYGLNAWNSSAWTLLSPVNPASMVASGSTLYAGFPDYGLYSWNGSAWTLLSPVNPASMVASGSTLYADFPGYGLYSWNDSAWNLLSPVTPASMVASGSTLYADFPGYGLYSWNGSAWTLLSPVNPTSMVASGSILYAGFPGYGLYSWNGSAWNLLSPVNPASMVASGSTLYADFAGYGLYSWNGSAWNLLAGDHPACIVASGSTLYADFAGYGLNAWNGTGWTQITPDHPTIMKAPGGN